MSTDLLHHVRLERVKGLQSEMIAQAYGDYCLGSRTEKVAARKYIYGNGIHPLSFRPACLALDLNPDAVIERIEASRPDEVRRSLQWLSHSNDHGMRGERE